MSRRGGRTGDRGFTLPELLIAVVLMAMLGAVLAATIVTAMRNAPTVMSRSETAVAVQGITTWLPPDVDSAEPGRFDTATGTASGCAGSDPGTNILRLQWSETFTTITTTYVANYRFVVDGDTARIVRLSCSGEFSLSAPSTLRMSAELAPIQPNVVEQDVNGDGKVDQVRISIVTLAGETVFIEAATKNPNETLPPVPTDPTTTTTTIADQPPVASPAALVANAPSTVTFVLPATDPEGGALTATVSGLPADWSATTIGTTVELVIGSGAGPVTFGYTVTDPAGSAASSTVTVDVVAGPLPPTTTTTTSTTTTTIPTCTVAAVAVSPPSVGLQSKGNGKLKRDVVVTLSGVAGYCVGLTVQYVTGGPNGQYVQSFGDTAPYEVTLLGHPHGTELWSTGSKSLEVRDGFDRLLASATLTVTG